MSVRTSALAAALLPLALLVACGDDGGGQTSEGPSPTEARSTDGQSPTSSTTSGSAEAGQCEYPEGGETAREVEPPPAEPVATGKVRVTIATNQGNLPAVLDAKSAPCTVNSFLSLAEQGYYDDTPCHRMADTPAFGILQCGDPSGTGRGGPGYTFADELSGDESYPAGTLAMANSGPDTNGSQFFVVFKDTEIAPQYTVFGQVGPKALKVVRQVAADGIDASQGPGDGSGPPRTEVKITSVQR